MAAIFTRTLNLAVLAVGLLLNFSTAAAQTGPYFDVNSYMERAVRYAHCTPEQTAKIDSSLRLGLLRVAYFNGPLLENRIALSGNRKAEFDCTANSAEGSDAQTFNRGSAILPFLRAKRLPVAKLKVAKLFQITGSFPIETTLLHEYLHFLEFDNFPVKYHNNADVVYTRGVATYDVVFSCAVAAYAVENSFHRFGVIAMYGLQTSRMAETCKAARVVDKRVTVPVEELNPTGSLRGPVECYLTKKSSHAESSNGINLQSSWPLLSDECSPENQN